MNTPIYAYSFQNAYYRTRDQLSSEDREVTEREQTRADYKNTDRTDVLT